MPEHTKIIKADLLTRVEGEGAMLLKIHGDELQDVQFKIFEPPRFFEAFLRGRRYTEVIDIVARICGICPIAYQMSAALALEEAFGIHVDGQLEELRRLIYCGEWIESHVLHIYMLHAPDFLGYDGVVSLAKDHPELVERALFLKKAGNDILEFLGGRAIHPVNIRVGGFYSLPTKRELEDGLLGTLKKARAIALETVHFTKTLPFPDFEQDYTFVSLHENHRYPFNGGRIISNTGMNISHDEFLDYFKEEHVERSNALQGHMINTEKPYATNPMARFHNNFEQLPEHIQELSFDIGLGKSTMNPFKSIIVRALEVLYACDEAIRIIEQYEPPEKPHLDYNVKESVGHGATEAPRGTIYHRYKVDADGIITDAVIIPPTSQNQRVMETDLWALIPKYIHDSDEAIQHIAEQSIRNYDPCISCATHFLNLTINRE